VGTLARNDGFPGPLGIQVGMMHSAVTEGRPLRGNVGHANGPPILLRRGTRLDHMATCALQVHFPDPVSGWDQASAWDRGFHSVAAKVGVVAFSGRSTLALVVFRWTLRSIGRLAFSECPVPGNDRGPEGIQSEGRPVRWQRNAGDARVMVWICGSRSEVCAPRASRSAAIELRNQRAIATDGVRIGELQTADFVQFAPIASRFGVGVGDRPSYPFVK
jgi:hypothetical protein